MKVTTKLEQEDFDAMHDVIYEVLGVVPTNEKIQEIWDSLPDHIQGTAIQWGTDDTVFRDELYVHLRDSK